ncbi:Polycystin-1 [Holothuria leucospilota]|uniref:Polycystin-1 n=1 Tax=Holothuria leucospilota TaxID=206669 RepID=A0A9Q1CMX1_HOLLE|nr:Polycystin-1 [Holothuria leucospilota]
MNTEMTDVATSGDTGSNQNAKSTFVVTSAVHVSTTQATPTAPVAVITAPSSNVPTCGTFTLTGIGSYSISSSIVKYTWSVESDVDYSGLGSTLQDANEGTGSTVLTLSGSSLNSEASYYRFTLVVEDLNGLTGSSTFNILVLATEQYSVSVSTTIDTTAADRTQEFQLRASVTFFEGCEASGNVQFSWSAVPADVLISLGITSDSALTIPENTLTAGEVATFTVEACLEGATLNCPTFSLNVTAAVPEIQAVISGPSTRLVSVSSGEISLDGSTSNDPSGLSGSLTYNWFCHLSTDNGYEACTDSAGDVFPSSSSSSTLTFSSSLLQSQSSYRFTLDVSKESRSSSAEVFLQTSTVETIDVSLKVEGASNAISANDMLTVKCSFVSSTTGNIDWLVTLADGSGLITLDDSTLAVPLQTQTDSSGMSVSILILNSGVLTAGELYVISTSVSNQNQETIGYSSVDVTVFSKPTGCQISVSGYTELSQVDLITSDCSTIDGYTPLLYTYYYLKNSDGDRQQLSLQGADPVVTVVGPGAIDNTNSITFVVEVCDQVGSCDDFSTTATVTSLVVVSEDEFTNFQQTYVTDIANSGNSLAALQNLNSILKTLESTGSSSVSNTSTVAELQADLLTTAYTQSDGASDVIEALLDQVGNIDTSSLEASKQDDVADVMTNILDDVIDGSQTITNTKLQTILDKAQNLQQDGVSNTKISNLESKSLKLISKNVLLGGNPVELSTADATYSVQKVTPCNEVNVNSDSTTPSVDMGSDVCNSYSTWTCSDGEVCLGVAVKAVLYNENVDYTSTAETTETFSSSILQLNLGDPNSDDNLDITDLTSPIILSVPISSFDNTAPYICKYWDASSQSWSTDGVVSVKDESTGAVQCQTNHLSSFVVVLDSSSATTTISVGPAATDDVAVTVSTSWINNPFYLAITIVGSLFVLFCLIVFIFFCVLFLVQRHQAKMIKSSQEVILTEMRTRREARRSFPNSPRGKVTPEPPPPEGEQTKMAVVPPSHEMEDPKVAWL